MASEIGPRITTQLLSVLGLMLEQPSASWYGLELAGKTGIRGGTIYPLLARLERAGWLESEFEAIDPSAEGRPRRRLYRLTGAGEIAARQRLVEADMDRRKRRSPSRPVRLPQQLPRGGTA